MYSTYSLLSWRPYLKPPDTSTCSTIFYYLVLIKVLLDPGRGITLAAWLRYVSVCLGIIDRHSSILGTGSTVIILRQFRIAHITSMTASKPRIPHSRTANYFYIHDDLVGPMPAPHTFRSSFGRSVKIKVWPLRHWGGYVCSNPYNSCYIYQVHICRQAFIFCWCTHDRQESQTSCMFFTYLVPFFQALNVLHVLIVWTGSSAWRTKPRSTSTFSSGTSASGWVFDLTI